MQKILFACVCAREEEKLPKTIERNFMVSLCQEKNYLFMLGNLKNKKKHI